MRLNFYVVTAFLLGFLQFFKIPFIGSLDLAEILMIGLAPLSIVALARTLRQQEIRSFFFFGALYLASQIFSDWYRHSPPSDYLRGWAKIGITLLSLLTFSALLRPNRGAALGFIIGSLGSIPASLIVSGPVFGWGNSYKFYFGPAISILAFFIWCYAPPAFRKVSIAFPIVAGILALEFDARALAGSTILAVVAGATSGIKLSAERKRGIAIRVQKRALVLTAIVFLGSGVAIFELYRYSASIGLLGSTALDKYEEQRNFRGTGAFSLFSGRNEAFFSVPKIVDSPLIGWGSWAKDSSYVFDRAQELGLNPEELAFSETPELVGVIPTHSHILGGWLEAGLLGGVFWLVVFWRTAHALATNVVKYTGKTAPLCCYMLISFAWDLMFSPYGSDRRITDGFLIAWIAWLEVSARLHKIHRSSGNFARPIGPQPNRPGQRLIGTEPLVNLDFAVARLRAIIG
jgi:hypothetical protein